MRSINDKIDTSLKAPGKIDMYYRPVTAFLTFENEEGLNRMAAYNELIETSDEYIGYENY